MLSQKLMDQDYNLVLFYLYNAALNIEVEFIPFGVDELNGAFFDGRDQWGVIKQDFKRPQGTGKLNQNNISFI